MMPIIHVHLLEGRSVERKAAAIARITEAAVETLDVTSEQVRVLLHEVPAAHWGAAGSSIADRRKAAEAETSR